MRTLVARDDPVSRGKQIVYPLWIDMTTDVLLVLVIPIDLIDEYSCHVTRALSLSMLKVIPYDA
jgi:hypothetical protein